MTLPVKKNNIYDIEILDLNHKGQGIGKIDGFTIFLNGGLPGDKAKVKIIDIKKSYGIGELISIEENSKNRVVPKCPVADVCGGCQIQQLNYSEQLKIKKEKVINDIKRIGGLDDIKVYDTIGMENPYRYRNKAQFPVKVTDNKVNSKIISFFYKINCSFFISFLNRNSTKTYN